MRAALLPSAGDPFLLAYWLRHYRTWRDEVQELRVLVNGQRNPELVAFMRALCEDVGAVFMHQDDRLDHGVAIGKLLDATSADLVMLCEEDAFVRSPKAVRNAFERIEQDEVDIVACPRSSVSDEVRDAAQRRYGHTPGVQSQESGASFWPAFFFGKREHLMATDRWFSAYGWLPGVEDTDLNFTPTVEGAGDTFVHTTYQLRSKGLRVGWESQFRADREQMERWLQYPASWFHVGSLSAGYGYVFCHEVSGLSDSFDRIAEKAKESPSDWEKRMSWWLRITEQDILPDHRAQYRNELERFTQLAELDRGEINRWTNLFDPWVAGIA